MADEPTKKPGRRFKNPETFRERVIKASEDSEKPKKSGWLKRLLSAIFGPAFRSIGSALKFLFYRPPFTVLRRPLIILGRILLPVYIRKSWHELKLVTWPSWRESRRLTYAVLIFAVIFGASIAIVDYGLDKVFRHILLK